MFGLFLPRQPSYMTAQGVAAQPTRDGGLLGFVNKILGASRPVYVGQAQAVPGQGVALFGHAPAYVQPALSSPDNVVEEPPVELPPPVVELIQDPQAGQHTVTIVITTK